ncbi:ras-related protein Rab-37-like isoform X1 [Coccinella septempunctata]|uniref:ras-related protein Rab-37-like isoform X1 n=1 Tax=Coccinella septempunctata TaxID=41139 RepID=UPI001D07526A|nr:ras-related protein Rab-37-like isoform X1 [Coccinella septempunctata]XP_044754843.1 ras-related protein Rab-37-like isoform X1 [Coccinella septempunctata]XP_044754844.1 ras-related protein Rab-37-like isoform X1 [Coccinella septempunctata]
MAATDDSMDDDVFETETDAKDKLRTGERKLPKTPSPTGYRGYKPPPEVIKLAQNDIFEDTEQITHKTILLGDSGVGKTSLLVKFDTGKFQGGSFSATVGIGFTIMLLGDSGVGKTCLLTQFRDGHFLSGNYIATIGVDFRNKIVTVDQTRIKLQIWDTAGQERFRSITHAYYRDAHALLLLYDVTNKTSFDNIRAWLGEIKEYAQEDVVIMLLGNKADCGTQRAVRREDGERLAREYNVSFMETSAKSGQNVDLAFLAVARELKCRQTGENDQNKFSVQNIHKEQTQKSQCPPCSS